MPTTQDDWTEWRQDVELLLGPDFDEDRAYDSWVAGHSPEHFAEDHRGD